MKNSKKGFTLTEILIVTAIIVILSGAAIAGIAVTVSNAKERGEEFQASQGVNWESEAVLKVKKTKIELGNEQIYEESADTPAPTGAASSDNKELDGEDDPNPSPDPDSKDPDPKDPDPKDPDPDPDPKDPDPDPDPKDPDPKTDPEPDPVVLPAGSPSYGDTGRPTTGTTTYGSSDTSAASGTSTEINQKGDQYNACRIIASIPSNTSSVVVYVDGAGTDYEFKSYNGTVTNLGNGYYRVNFYDGQNPTSIQIYSEGNNGFKGATTASVVEYTTTT